MHVKTRRAVAIAIALTVVFTSMAVGIFADKSSASGMVMIGSREELIDALKNVNAVRTSIDEFYYRKYPPIVYSDYDMAMEEAVPAPEATADANEAVSTQGVSDYSQTNVQVQGVDEGDIVKTDGSYLYQIIDNRIVIAAIYPASDMSLVSKIDLGDQNFYPTELYVDGDRLVVVGGSYYGYEIDYYSDYMLPSSSYTKVLIYDIYDRSSPSLLKEMDLEGNYLSSRKVGDMFYFAANKYYYGFDESRLDEVLPHYRVGTGSQKYSPIAFNRIGYFDNACYENFLTLGAINVQNPSEYQVSAYLGSGETMYMSRENMYLAGTQYDIVWKTPVSDGSPGEISDITGMETAIYKFALNGASLDYQSTGEVPGSVLNQWSMDEYNGNFRIATTNRDINWWWWNESETQNNVYVLDSSMNTIGRLENLAPGEQIYSSLFMGKRLYLVTFRQVDPFFVIDLSAPSSPKVLGKLKIPGYSNYMYPYDDDHIIGFGMETEDQWGGVVPAAMKVGLFDVSDVSNPYQISQVTIGDRGTYSELLYNHKALFFNRANGLMAFPVTVMEAGDSPDDGWSYGKFAYQGAYIYKVDLNGIHFQYRLTHMSDKDYAEASDWYYGGEKEIKRILYVNDIIYTVSNAYWMANDLTGFNQLAKMTTSGVNVGPVIDGSTPNPSGEIRVVVDGSELVMDEPPLIQDGRLMVPVRAVFEALGAQLMWNGDDQSIVAISGTKTIKMVVGENTALINGIETPMELAPMVSGERVLVPLRFVSEALGAVAEWNGETRTATITSP